MSDVKENVSDSFTFTAFSDSVDTGGGGYPVDICGDKTITLTTAPTFLTVTNGSDLNNFSLDYDELLALESHIMTHTVDYQVVITEYAAQTTALTS